MTVYIDDMCNSSIGEFRRMKMSHMIADTLDELHAMADKIGVARKWFQADSSFPHYDVCKSKRAEAFDHGATPITLRQLVKVTHDLEQTPEYQEFFRLRRENKSSRLQA